MKLTDAKEYSIFLVVQKRQQLWSSSLCHSFQGHTFIEHFKKNKNKKLLKV